ncbi:hypothetical protein B0H13DRAFT_2665803 [Mycena leptocephala]|nr:hypothetical protein B0H13DRAFT_2665803 [Mycena leptocephala]
MIRRPCFPSPSESALAFLPHNFLYLDHNKSKLPRFIGHFSPLNAVNNDLVPSSNADSRLPELEHLVEHIMEIAAPSHPTLLAHNHSGVGYRWKGGIRFTDSGERPLNFNQPGPLVSDEAGLKASLAFTSTTSMRCSFFQLTRSSQLALDSEGRYSDLKCLTREAFDLPDHIHFKSVTTIILLAYLGQPSLRFQFFTRETVTIVFDFKPLFLRLIAWCVSIL